jgi:hypothetical protein
LSGSELGRMRESLQILAFVPLRMTALGESLSFPSAANPEASNRWKFLNPTFMADSIPQGAYQYTGEFRGNYMGYSLQPRAVAGIQTIGKSSIRCGSAEAYATYRALTVSLGLIGAPIPSDPDQGRVEEKPKLRLEKIVSKSVSRERGSGFVQITLSSQLPSVGITNVARPM